MDLWQMDITREQAEAIARGMFAVARAERGLHEREVKLIQRFYAEVIGGDAAGLDALAKASDIAPEEVASVLRSAPLKRMFLRTCILLAHADGDYGLTERKVVESYARALQVGPELLAAYERSVEPR